VSAAGTARAEAELWVGMVDLHEKALRLGDPDPVAREFAVTGFDPSGDLDRRAVRWGHRLDAFDFAELARFAAGLAMAEAEAWDRDDPVVATQAFDDRRFLFSDRIVHWMVPWADVAGRCHPGIRQPALALRDRLLDLGDRMRPAPLISGDEGLYPPGEDAFGPVETEESVEVRLRSLHSGTVVFRATVRSLMGADHSRGLERSEVRLLAADLCTLFEGAAAGWRSLAESHPGTARLWRDLANRAERTARLLTS
jgi:hypothetical protein